MLKDRRFNIIYIDKDHARELNLDNPVGQMVKYSGKEMIVSIQ